MRLASNTLYRVIAIWLLVIAVVFGHNTAASGTLVTGGAQMAAGVVAGFVIGLAIAGSFIGGRLLGLVPAPVLLPLLGVFLVLSAIKVWRHK